MISVVIIRPTRTPFSSGEIQYPNRRLVHPPKNQKTRINPPGGRSRVLSLHSLHTPPGLGIQQRLPQGPLLPSHIIITITPGHTTTAVHYLPFRPFPRPPPGPPTRHHHHHHHSPLVPILVVFPLSLSLWPGLQSLYLAGSGLQGIFSAAQQP
jgi:hypothetical protein